MLLLVPFFSLCVQAAKSNSAKLPVDEKAQPVKTIVIVGDSLTEGYGVAKESAFPALLENKLNQVRKEWSVINSGVSGATTGSAVNRVRWVLKAKPDLILLFLGANDGLRGLKVSESEKNLDVAIQLAKSNKVQVILGGLYMPPNYGQKYRSEFEKMYATLAAKHSIQLIPFILKGVAGKKDLNLADGIHPNELGHKVIAENIYTFLKGHL